MKFIEKVSPNIKNCTSMTSDNVILQ